MLVDNFAQPATRHVRIHLRGGNIGVTQHDLDAAQVRAALHQMRGKTVPDDVRGQPAEDSRAASVLADQSPERLPGHGRPACRDEQVTARPALQQFWSPGLQIAVDRGAGGVAKRDHALLVALTDDFQHAHAPLHGG